MSVSAKVTPQTDVQKAYQKTFTESYSPQQQALLKADIQAEYDSMASDPAGGAKKIESMQTLGIRRVGQEIEVADFTSLLGFYLQAHKKQKRTDKNTILPAAVLVLGEPGKISQFLLVTPGIDPWPTEPGYRFLFSNEVFNIPFRSIIAGLKAGRFPMMDSFHDVSHFLSFYQNKAYTAKLIEMAQKLPTLEKYPISYSRRLFFALEFLTLGDPEQILVMKQNLLFPGIQNGKKKAAYSDYLGFFLNLEPQALLAHAQKLTELYDTLLVDYGGGSFRRFEENEMIINDYGLRTNDSMVLYQILGLFRDDLSEVQRSMMGAVPSWTLKGLLRIQKLSPSRFQKVKNENMFIANHFAGGDASSKLHALIAQQVARMEYGLWESANHLSAEKWVADTLGVHMKPNSPVLQFARDFYGPNSPIFQILSRGIAP